MKLASNIEANNVLTLILVVVSLLVIDVWLVPWIISSPYKDNFRADSIENLAEFINFANNYNGQKVYFVGSSVFFGHGLEKRETIPVKFEKCSGIKTFNLALGGGKLEDQIKIINLLNKNVQIIFEVNPLAFGGKERLTNLTLAENKTSLDKLWVPNMYSKRYLLQEFLFEKSTKEYILQLYGKLLDPDYGATKSGKVDFSSKQINIDQEHIQMLESSAGKRVTFVLIPIFNTTYTVNSSKIKDRAIDLTRLNIPKEDYLDLVHLREHGAEIIAENLCKKVKL
ncbi:hypothetical protein HYX16_03595 [Candidatus Woesearchaeota archaeon]|nr:hypothetical protein [Candidatus Woesearchaeota archaeon]